MKSQLFTNFSNFDFLQFLIGESPQDLLEQLRLVQCETSEPQIYAYGSRHIAWFYTSAIIKKNPKKTEKLNNGSS